jgi:hypothetical protein
LIFFISKLDLIIKNFYSTKNKNLGYSLNPWYITGFCDAESCFNLSVSKISKGSTGYRVQARFIIEIHIKEIGLLYKIQSFFGGSGSIRKDLNKNSCTYSVVGLSDINKFILPHFLKYPLQSVKLIDFEFWFKAVNLINSKKHLTQEGLYEFISLKSAMNLGLSEKLKLEFPDIKLLNRPDYMSDDKGLDPNWITGFIEGDGSFHIYINKKNNNLAAFLAIGLNIREKLLLLKIKKFFNGKGGVYTWNVPREVAEWKVSRLSDLILISSHFEKYPLMDFKNENFQIWRKILFLMEKKTHLTPEGFNLIKSLKNKLNKYN